MKRLIILDRLLLLFFGVNIFLEELNKKLFNSFVNKEIIDYLFWFSLGLFLGFQLFKYELNKVYKDNPSP